MHVVVVPESDGELSILEVAGHDDDDGDVIRASLILQPQLIGADGELQSSFQQVLSEVDCLQFKA